MGERRLGVRLRRAGGLMGRHSWEVVVVVLKFPILLKTSNVMESTSKTPKNNAGFWYVSQVQGGDFGAWVWRAGEMKEGLGRGEYAAI